MSHIVDEERYQCWADLALLDSNSTYIAYASVDIAGSSIKSATVKFRTTSSGSDLPVQFASGGDYQFANAGIFLAKQAASNELYFAIAGGDIAYDNGMAHCYRKWDYFLTSWSKYMKTPQGYNLPIVTAIGNHEAGGFKQPRSNNANYLRMFPHSIGLQSTDPQARSTLHYHLFGGHSM